MFLGLINSEADKHSDCLRVWEEAVAGDTVIVTSFFTWTEVFKKKCEIEAKPLSEEGDVQIEALLSQPFIEAVVVDEGIGTSARRLMRRHPQCKKPTDGLHLSTALRMNVDELHTYDGSDLLKLDGQVKCENGQVLRICTPSAMPKKPSSLPPAPLFERLEEGKK